MRLADTSIGNFKDIDVTKDPFSSPLTFLSFFFDKLTQAVTDQTMAGELHGT